jgi:hypothetical protein
MEKSILKKVELGARVSMQVAEAKKDMLLLVALSALGRQVAESQSTYLFAFLFRNVREEQKKARRKLRALASFFKRSASERLDPLRQPGNAARSSILMNNTFLGSAHHDGLSSRESGLGSRSIATFKRFFNLTDVGAHLAAT